MIKLKAPHGATSASFNGEEYQVEDGHVHVPDGALEALGAHGFALPTDDAVDESEPANDPAGMGRKELFAFLKGRGVAATATLATEDLRKIAIDAATKDAVEAKPNADTDTDGDKA